ncbi:protein O-mannosyl-transferase TMTC2-like isoform X2 [Oratosquilla oratoria]|uniref:protein O-mannosyl-transferase TMTC2-like isoform X2 n=1 Tax=Oratosquilla oratoria TaxID=337810 RepID=UPI003F77591F
MSRRRHHHQQHHSSTCSTCTTSSSSSSSPPSASPSPSRPSQSPAPGSSRRCAQAKVVTAYSNGAKGPGAVGAALLAPSGSSGCGRSRAQRQWRWLTWRMAVTAPVVLSLLLFVDTLRCGFVYDDHRAVLGNRDVVGVVATSSPASFTSPSSSSSPASSSSWTDIWGNDFWGTPVTSSGSHGSWRPLTTLSFRINAVLASVLAAPDHDPEVPPSPPPPLHAVPSASSPSPSPSPSSSSSPPPLPAWTFHAVNVAIHAGVTGAYVGVLRAHGVGRLAALTAGLLFAAHPAHVEAVAGVVGRAELLAGLGFCLALAAHAQYVRGTARASSAPSSSSSECSSCLCPAHKSHDADAAVATEEEEERQRKGPGGGGSGHPSSRWAWLAFSVVMTGVAMLCKEQGVAALPVATLLHAFGLYRRRSRRKGGAKEETALSCAASLLPASASFALLVYLRLWWVPLTPSFTAADNPIAHAPDRVTRGLSILRTWAQHAKLLLLPSTLSFDWSVDAVPLVTSFTDPVNLEALVLLGFLAALAFRVVLGGPEKDEDDDDGGVDEDNDASQRQRRNQQRLAACRYTVDDDVDDDLHDRLNNNVCRRRMDNDNNDDDADDDGGGFWRALFSPASSRSSEHMALALALAVVPFLPASNLLVYVGFVVAERVLYIPSMGFCLIVALGVERLAELAARHQQERQTSDDWATARGASTAAWTGANPGGGGTKPCTTPPPPPLRGPSRRSAPTPSFLGATLRREWRQALVLSGALLLLALYGGRTLRRNLDWQSDETLYSVSLSVTPAKALANLGVVYAESGRIRQAEEAYRAALRHTPNTADTNYNLGLLLAEQGRTKEAVHSYQLALGARPWLAQAHLALAAALHQLGRRHEAIKVLEVCSSLGEAPVRDAHTHLRNKATCQQRLARAHLLGGRPSDALVVLQSALQQAAPGGSYQPLHSFYTLLAEAHLALGAPDEAEAYLQEALRERPNHVPAYITYAKVLQANGSRAGVAESWLRRALVLDPREVHAHKHLGQLLLDQGRLEEAVTAWLTATTLDPDDHTAAFNAATALRLAGRTRHAEVLYRRAAQLQPQDLASLRNLGAILHVNGKLEEALTQYEKALRVAPEDPQTSTNLARLLRLMQEKAA